MKKSYRVVAKEAWVNGVLYGKGGSVDLTEDEAKYYVAPLGDTLELEEAKRPAKAPAKTPAKPMAAAEEGKGDK